MKENVQKLIKVPDSYEEPTEEAKQTLRNLMRTLNALSYEELDAIGGEIEMTEDMFEHCLLACIHTDNFRLFDEIWNDFPDFNAAIALKAYEILQGSELLKSEDMKNMFLNTVLLRIEELFGE